MLEARSLSINRQAPHQLCLHLQNLIGPSPEARTFKRAFKVKTLMISSSTRPNPSSILTTLITGVNSDPSSTIIKISRHIQWRRKKVIAVKIRCKLVSITAARQLRPTASTEQCHCKVNSQSKLLQFTRGRCN